MLSVEVHGSLVTEFKTSVFLRTTAIVQDSCNLRFHLSFTKRMFKNHFQKRMFLNNRLLLYFFEYYFAFNSAYIGKDLQKRLVYLSAHPSSYSHPKGNY